MNQRSALVIRGGAIGDFILTLPAIRLLRESIADCRLEVLGYPGIAELAVAAGYVEAVHNLEHRRLAMLFVPGAALEEELVAWLKSFNVIVSYLYDPDGIVRANMERIGVRTYLDAPHRVAEGAGHAAVQLARPLESLAMYLEDPAPRIQVANAWPGSKRIAIHPGSGSVKKTWPVEHWRAVAETLSAQQSVVLITGEAERERGITEALEDLKNVERWDSLPLTELAIRLPSCAVFLGHDSGIGHLAAACGVPCHLFFGPTDPAVWAPRNSNITVMQAPQGDLTALPQAEGMASLLAF